MNTINADSTVGQLVVERPSRSKVFQKLGIDFCCGGKKRLADVCRDKGLDTGEVLRELAADEGVAGRGDLDVSTMTLTQLCDHIEQTHHAFLHAELPRVSAMAKRVATVHGAHHPWTVELASVFSKFAAELDAHMLKEERVLFPWIRSLETTEQHRAGACGSSIANPIRMMEHEHNDAGRALERMRELSGGFAPPTGACNTFIAMLDGMARIEDDMFRHVHKENNVLFPKAAQREQMPCRV